MNNKLSIEQREASDDEINLHEVLLVLVEKKKLIFFVTVLFFFMAIIYVLLVTPIYQVKSSFLPPLSKDVAVLNIKDVSDLSRKDLYLAFESQLNSSALRRVVFNELGLDKENKRQDKDNIDDVFTSYFKTYVVAKESVKKDVASIGKMSLTLTGENPTQLATVINLLVKKANINAINNVVDGINGKIEKKIDILLSEISNLKITAKVLSHDEVLRLKDENELEKKIIEDRINAKKMIAQRMRDDKLKALSEAVKIARDISLQGVEAISLDSSVNVNVNVKDKDKDKVLMAKKPLLYLRGEKALNAEIEALKNRRSNEPYIEGLRDLEEKLALLQHDRKGEAIANRKNNDIYIKSLREKEEKLAYFRSLIVSAENINAASIDQLAFAPNKPIKPKKLLVVLVGLLLGLFFGVLLAFFIDYIKKNPLSE